MAETVPKEENNYLPLKEEHTQGPPPAYGTQDPIYDDLPPSYYSIYYQQVKDAKNNSSGFCDFVKKFFIIILSTICFTLGLALLSVIPICMIAIGAVYIDDCPIQKYIPIYLIVGGTFWIVKNLSLMIQNTLNNKNNRQEQHIRPNAFDGLLNIFLLCWFVAGNYWVYSTKYRYQGVDPDAPRYCDPVLYGFAFWITTVLYIILVTVACCCCCCICFSMCAFDEERAEAERRIVEQEGHP